MEEDAGMDWLSDLPEEILHRIMSFLNARQAVQTCVLSRRWRNLWRTVPCINVNFDEFDFVWYQGDNEDYIDDVAFKRFVNRLLELRDPTAMMDTFWLRYSKSYHNTADADRRISHALQKQARVLEVVVFPYELKLDHSVLASRYLRRIGFCCVYLGRGFFKQLEAGCPALEDLILHECSIWDNEISSHSLKVVTINRTEFSMEKQKSISLPSATSLTLSNHESSTPMLIKDMSLLVTASVSITLHAFNMGFRAKDLCQYLWSLSGVKDLEFNYQATEEYLSSLPGFDDLVFNYQGTKLTIRKDLQWCPEFINLVNLTLGQWCLEANFYALIVFLQNSPRLQKLTLKLANCTREKSERILVKPAERAFTWEHLKIVEVRCSEDDPRVTSVEDFFLNCGMNSIQIHIKHWSQNEDDLPAFIQKSLFRLHC